MKKIVIGLILMGLFSQSSYAGKYGTAVTRGGQAKMSFRVLDDEGQPVGSATVRAAFYFDLKKQGMIISETDTNGVCSVEGITHMDVSYQIQKDGCYRTDGCYVFGMVEPPVINNCWQPWDPTNTVILKRMKNPVPMYVKSLNVGVPEFGKSLGFDIEKGDWVTPYGQGASSDLLFYPELAQRSSDDFDYTLTLTFPNEKDGIQTFKGPTFNEGSQLKSNYETPKDGYLSEWKQFRKRRLKEGETNNIDENRTYYFRVRTVLDKDGNIVSALYGKIYGDFLNFTYYLNPTPNDRNIEFDPAKNLFGGRDRFAP